MQGPAVRMTVSALFLTNIYGSATKIIVVVIQFLGRNFLQMCFKIFQKQGFIFI